MSLVCVEVSNGIVIMVFFYGMLIIVVGNGVVDYIIIFLGLKREVCVRLLENVVGFSFNLIKVVVFGIVM